MASSENGLSLVHDIGTLSKNAVRPVRRPYKCTFCIKTFTVHSNLVKHTRTHTGERPFKCDVCGKAFANPSNMTRHRRLHTGYLPHTCGFCQKGFRDSCNLRYHLKTHLNDKSFKCQECGDTFTVFTDYCAHMKVHFDITSELLAKTSSLQKELMLKVPAARKAIPPASSSFSSFTSSNVETDDNMWKMSLKAAISISNDVENYDNKPCDIVVLNDSGCQIDNPTTPTNHIIPKVELTNLSKDLDSDFSADQIHQEPNLDGSLSRNVITSEEIVDFGSRILLPKQENETDWPIEESETIKFPESTSSAIDLKDWNLFSLKDEHFDTDIVQFEASYEKEKSSVFEFSHLDEINLRDDATCTLDELANKLTQCSYCERIFSLEDASKQLIDGKKPFCGTCDKTSSHKIPISDSSNPQETNLCVLCGSSFEEPIQLKQHICVTNINGKRYNPCLKSPTAVDSNVDRDLNEFDSLKNDFTVHHGNSLDGIKVLDSNSQHLTAGTFVKNGETTAQDFFRKPAGMVRQVENEEDNEVVIVAENVWETIPRDDGLIEKEKLIGTVERDVCEDFSQAENKDVFIIDDDDDEEEEEEDSIIEFGATQNGINRSFDSKNNLTDKHHEDYRNFSDQSTTKTTDTSTPAKSEIDKRSMQYKRRKLIQNKLKNYSLQQTSKGQDNSGSSWSSLELGFRCDYCNKHFSIQSNLIKHIRIHTGEKPFKCSFCGTGFANSSNLTRHVRTHTGEKPYKCSYCERRFRASSNMRSHQRTHFKSPPLKCNICGQQFALVALYRSHLKSHEDEQGLSPEDANTNLVGMETLINKQNSSLCSSKQNSNDRIIPFLIEPYANASNNSDDEEPYVNAPNQSLSQDNSEEKNVKQNPIQIASNQVSNNSILTKSQEYDDINHKHLNQNDLLVIDLENNSLNSYDHRPPCKDSDSTVVSAHSDSDNRLFSSKFHEISVDKTKLPNSISPESLGTSTESKLFPYKCVYCSKGFAVHCNLVKHIHGHTGERVFSCSQCSKSFANPSNLTRHLKIHTSECAYKCHLCSQSFRSASNLHIHLKSHSSAEQLKCSVCEQTFDHDTELKTHLRTHKKDRKVKRPAFRLGRSFCSRVMIPSLIRLRKAAVAKQNASKDVAVSYKQKSQSSFMSESSLSLSANDSTHITEMLTSKLPTQRSPFVTGKENSSHLQRFGSVIKEISEVTSNKMSNYCVQSQITHAMSGIVSLNEEDAPNRLLSSKSVPNSVSRDKIPPEKENFLHEVEPSHLDPLDENDNEGTASVLFPANHIQSSQVKCENLDTSSVIEAANSAEASATSTRTSSVKRRTSKLHKCRFCGRMFPSHCNLVKHVRTHTGERPFRCKSCRAAFANPSNLTRHIRTHTGEKPYLCPHCSKTFGASSNLKQHLRTHKEGMMPYRCRHCTRTFSMFSNFKLHMWNHCKSGQTSNNHTSTKDSSSLSMFLEKNPSDCNSVSSHPMSDEPETLKDQQQQSEINRLQLKETEETLDLNFTKQQISETSQICKTKLSQSVNSSNSSPLEMVSKNNDPLVGKPINYDSKNAEQNVKPDFPPIENNICSPLNNKTDFSPTQANVLVVPIFKRKLAKSNHKCVYCEKTFSVSSNLTKHVRTHTGEKPFRCRFCSKAFANPSNLIRHERIHTGEQPYECPHCQQRFGASGNLKEHVKKHNAHATLNSNRLLHLSSLSKRILMKRKQKILKTKRYGIKSLSQMNHPAREVKVSTDDTCSDDGIAECNSKVDDHNVSNQYNILEQPFEKGRILWKCAPSLGSEPNSLAANSLTSNYEKQEEARNLPVNRRLVVKQELPQQVDMTSLIDGYCLQSTERTENDQQETMKEDPKNEDEEQNFTDLIPSQKDHLVLSNQNSMDLLNAEKNMELTEVSDMAQSMDLMLCKEEFPNNVSSNPKYFENSFTHQKERESSQHQCQVCYLTFLQSHELQQHMELHATSLEDGFEIKDGGNHGEKFSQDSLEYLITNTENKNKSFDAAGELYVCKYGCQTFDSYVQLCSHMKSAHNNKEFMKNTINTADDDVDNNVQPKLDHQKESSSLPDSLNTAVPSSSLDLNIHNRNPFTPSLDSSQSFTLELIDLERPGTSSSPPLAQSGKLNNFPIAWHHARNMPKPHQCPYCVKTFSKRGQLTKHIRTHTGETPHKCRYCGTGFANPSNLTRHIRTHTGEKPYQCPTCKKAFGNSSNMKEHRKIHSKISLYKCRFCAKNFSNFHSYKTHLKSHSKHPTAKMTRETRDSPVNVDIDNESNFISEIIELYKETTDKTFLSQSVSPKAKSNTFDFSDLIVDKQNDEIIRLDKNATNYHPIIDLDDIVKASPNEDDDDDASSFHQQKNPKQTEQLINLVDFYPFSSDEKPNSNRLQKRNYRNHVEKRQNNSFELRRNRTARKTSRTKGFQIRSQPLQLHVCSYCGKSFTIHSNLRKHIRIHTGERPFKCNTCDAAFANPSNLTRHIRTHTGEKPYLCPHCSKSFRASSNLKVHLKMIHTQY